MSETKFDHRFPYVLVLTHDLDLYHLSALPRRWRVLAGFVFRNLIHNSLRVITGRLRVRSYLHGIVSAFTAPLALLGVLPDPLGGAVRAVKEKEQQLGVRSTFYFVAAHARAGFRPGGRPAPAVRAVHYRLEEVTPLIRELEAGGWEIGVHGIDSYRDLRAASAELHALSGVVVGGQLGHRSHWLYSQGRRSWDILSMAGFAYDASYGWNDKIGWPGGKRWPFRPFPKKSFVVLPLNVQDGAVMRGTLRQAWRHVHGLLCNAKQHGGTLTVLWHPSSFGPPRYWGDIYQRIIVKAQADKALIVPAGQAIAFWRKRGEPRE